MSTQSLESYLCLLFPEPGLPRELSDRLEELRFHGAPAELLRQTQRALYELPLEGIAVTYDSVSGWTKLSWSENNLRCGIWSNGILLERQISEESFRTKWIQHSDVATLYREILLLY
jgi:hypothetical protein